MSAWHCWRKQWQERIPLTESQLFQKDSMKASEFNQLMRTNFGAFSKNYIGETAVAKFIINTEWVRRAN